MSEPHDTATPDVLPTPDEVRPPAPAELVDDERTDDDVVDTLDEPVELPDESNPADAVEQLLEVGYEDERDAPA